MLPVLFQVIYIPLGICSEGQYSKGPRGKNAELERACFAKCLSKQPTYTDGSCPRGSVFRPPADCPNECTRAPMDAEAVWVGAAIEAIIMVRSWQLVYVLQNTDYYSPVSVWQIYLGYILWSVWQRCKDSCNSFVSIYLSCLHGHHVLAKICFQARPSACKLTETCYAAADTMGPQVSAPMATVAGSYNPVCQRNRIFRVKLPCI
jgi:hypothetical protein